MSLFIMVEILTEDGKDGREIAPEDVAFEVEQLRLAEGDRKAPGGYVNLDTTNYVFPVRVAGVVRGTVYGDPKAMIVEELVVS